MCEEKIFELYMWARGPRPRLTAPRRSAWPAALAGRRWQTHINIYIKGRGIYGGEGCRGKRKVVVIRPGVAGKRRDCRSPWPTTQGWVGVFVHTSKTLQNQVQQDNLPYVAFSGHTALSENAAPHGHSVPSIKCLQIGQSASQRLNPAHHPSWAYSWHLDLLLIPAALHLLIIEAWVTAAG
jgi:hypothetical protein